MKSLKVRDAIHGTVEVTKVFPGDIIAEERDLTQDDESSGLLFDRREPGTSVKAELCDGAFLDGTYDLQNFGGLPRDKVECKHPIPDFASFVGREAFLSREYHGRSVENGWGKLVPRGTPVYIVSQDPYQYGCFIVTPKQGTTPPFSIVVTFDHLDFPEDKVEALNEVTVRYAGITSQETARRISAHHMRSNLENSVRLSTPVRILLMLEALLEIGEIKFQSMPDDKVFVSLFPKDMGSNWFYEIGTIDRALEMLYKKATKLKLLPVFEKR